MRLDLTPRLSDPDGLFAALVAAHDGLGQDASRRLDAQLVLLLANHIGDALVVLDAIDVAQSTGETPMNVMLRTAGADPAPGDDRAATTPGDRS